MVQEARGHEYKKERGQTHVRGWKEEKKKGKSHNYTLISYNKIKKKNPFCLLYR